MAALSPETPIFAADPAVVALARSLRLRANALLLRLGQAAHPRRRAGQASAFREFREYLPGDDAKRIDWRAYARLGRPLVRVREDEGQQDLLLRLDAGGSMRFGDGAANKLAFAASVALALAQVALKQGDRVGLEALSPSHVALPPLGGARQLAHVAHALAHLVHGSLADKPPASRASLGREGRRARAIVLSDCLTGRAAAAATRAEPAAAGRAAETPAPSLAPLATLLAQGAARGHRTSVVHVVHPDEIALPYRGVQAFVGLPPGPVRVANVDRDGPAYRARMQAHLAAVAAMARGAGAAAHVAVAGEPCAALLRALCAAPT